MYDSSRVRPEKSVVEFCRRASWVDLFYSLCLLVLETFVNPPVPGTDGGSEAIPFTASSYSQADDESPPPPPGTFILKTLMGQ